MSKDKVAHGVPVDATLRQQFCTVAKARGVTLQQATEEALREWTERNRPELNKLLGASEQDS